MQSRASLQAVKDPETGKIETEPTKQAQIFEKYFKDSWQAFNIKHGTYLPKEAPRNYPWDYTENEQENNPPDPFKLQTITMHDESDSTKDRNWLHSSILGKSAYNECIKTLSNNKSPEPDGIVNELLRMVPTEIQETIHMLFIIMWTTGFTPKAWKISNTILIDKTKEMKQRHLPIAQLA